MLERKGSKKEDIGYFVPTIFKEKFEKFLMGLARGDAVRVNFSPAKGGEI